MTLTTDKGDLVFDTAVGRLTMPELAILVRTRAGYTSPTRFEIAKGIDHPRWWNMEKGRFKSPRLLLEVLVELGYTITITKEGKR